MSFLQSREWEEIQKKIGRTVKRIGPVLVIRHDLPYGYNYLYSPRPRALSPEFLAAAGKWAKENQSIFLKVDPDRPLDGSLGGKKGNSLQPSSTILIDCRKTEDQLLVAMHPKTRYNIRLADRRGVVIRPIAAANVGSYFETFWALMQETASRDRFFVHPREHYQALFAVKDNDFENQLWLAEYGGEIVAAAIVNFFRPEAKTTYLHGASAGEAREVMAPHLLHWEIIRAVKFRGFGSYDFGGIDEEKWPGLTRFKKGFGGDMVNFPDARDFVFRKALYWLYSFQHRIRHGF